MSSYVKQMKCKMSYNIYRYISENIYMFSVKNTNLPHINLTSNNSTSYIILRIANFYFFHKRAKNSGN